jgi:hypothetical protein
MTFEQIAAEVGKTVSAKNKVYGDSFGRSSAFLNILYPDGIRNDQYDDILLISRIFDKLMRIATGAKDEENPYLDVAGYAILGLNMHNKEKGKDGTNKKEEPEFEDEDD